MTRNTFKAKGTPPSTAEKDAEIEALRAEVDLRDSVIATHAADTREYQKRISQTEALAERLAEALRDAQPFIGWTGSYPELHARIDALLHDQEEGHEQ